MDNVHHVINEGDHSMINKTNKLNRSNSLFHNCSTKIFLRNRFHSNVFLLNEFLIDPNDDFSLDLNKLTKQIQRIRFSFSFKDSILHFGHWSDDKGEFSLVKKHFCGSDDDDDDKHSSIDDIFQHRITKRNNSLDFSFVYRNDFISSIRIQMKITFTSSIKCSNLKLNEKPIQSGRSSNKWPNEDDDEE